LLFLENMKTFLLPALIFLLSLSCTRKDPCRFTLAAAASPVPVYLDKQADELIKWAAGDLMADLEEMTGMPGSLHYVDRFERDMQGILVGTCDDSLIRTAPVDPGHSLKDQWERFIIREHGGNLYLVGSDVRGTVYAVFELAERIGISPWKWWADVRPLRTDTVVLNVPAGGIEKGPSVKYRGIFLNDEDWGLQPWAAVTFEPETGDIGPKTYERIFQLLLRLKANTLWPAMHPCTGAFFSIPGNREMAEKYHICIGTSHAEPMLRNNVDEWDQEQYGAFNYLTNREKVLAYWEERIAGTGNGEYLYTVGMRGIHDSGMEGDAGPEERVNLLETVIRDQRDLLSRKQLRPPEEIPQVFIPYKEVLELYEQGLRVPDDITLVWTDDNYGYIRRLSNEEEQLRKGGSGVYYHLSYWGRPHDYLWLSTTQPALIWYEMTRAWQNGARTLWIANVGDIKPAEYTTEFFLDLAWDVEKVGADSIGNHLLEWCRREFGGKPARGIADMMDEYYRLAFLRKPEFMGWSRTEPTTGTRPGEFTQANHNELQRRIDAYRSLYDRAGELKAGVPEARQDAYFQLVEYPAKGAALMNFKYLYARQSMLTGDRTARAELAVKAQQAHDEITALTNRYNREISGGKWKGIMSMHTRGLPVFSMPSFHLSADPVMQEQSLASDPAEQEPRSPAGDASPLTIPANTFSHASGAGDYRWIAVEGLGYGHASMTLAPFDHRRFERDQPFLEYEFPVDRAGDYVVELRCLPTHSRDFDFRLGIAVNGAGLREYALNTHGRSEAWKENVLRNAVRILHPVRLEEAGMQTLKICVSHTGIVLDQIAVYPKGYPPFYEISRK
jgi:hypothetical protein